MCSGTTYNLNTALNTAVFLSHVSQRELPWQQKDMNMKRIKTLNAQESFVMGGLEKFMQLSKLKSWVSTWVVLNWAVESKSLGKWQIPTDVHLSAYWLDNWLKAVPTYVVAWISHLGLINPLTTILQRKRQVNCGITKHNSNTNIYEHKIISCCSFALQYFLHFIPGLPPMSKTGYSQHYELCSSPPESRCST